MVYKDHNKYLLFCWASQHRTMQSIIERDIFNHSNVQLGKDTYVVFDRYPYNCFKFVAKKYLLPIDCICVCSQVEYAELLLASI